jgi:hypothetical protein
MDASAYFLYQGSRVVRNFKAGNIQGKLQGIFQGIFRELSVQPQWKRYLNIVQELCNKGQRLPGDRPGYKNTGNIECSHSGSGI